MSNVNRALDGFKMARLIFYTSTHTIQSYNHNNHYDWCSTK